MPGKSWRNIYVQKAIKSGVEVYDINLIIMDTQLLFLFCSVRRLHTVKIPHHGFIDWLCHRGPPNELEDETHIQTHNDQILKHTTGIIGCSINI